MTEIICEHNTATLSCPVGTLTIVYANYGRMAPGTVHCPHESITDLIYNCSAATSMIVVTSTCSGLTQCTLTASNSVYGDPCVGTYKYLEVEYTCDGVD